MKTTKLIVTLLCLITWRSVNAQSGAANQNNQVSRPTIMVLPFIKEGEDVRKIIESDINQRIILTKIREAFDSRGYSTQDYVQLVKNLLNNGVLNDAQADNKMEKIITASGADISVEVEYNVQKNSLGNSVRLILTAFESSTLASLSNKVGQGPAFKTDDIGALAAKAVETLADDFLDVIQQKFDDINTNGKYMSIEFGLANDSEVTMETEIGRDGQATLSDAIENWISNNSNYYHILAITKKKAIYDQVRLPKSNKAGKNMTTTMYGLDLHRFCKTLVSDELRGSKFTVTRFNKGNTLFVNFK